MSSSSASKNSTTVRSRTAVRLTKAALQTAFVVSEDLGASLAERVFTSPRRFGRPARERALLASARRTTTRVTLRSGSIAIPTWRWGHGNGNGNGNGPTVLLVHGWEGRGAQLGAFVEPLLQLGLSVVTFDAPAHGDAPGSRLYLTDLADTIAAVAAAIEADDHAPLHGIIAHSFGAAGTLLAGVRNNLRTARNVMISPNTIVDDAVVRFARLVGLDDTDRILLEQRILEHTGLAVSDLRLEALTAARDEHLLIIHDTDDREVPIRHGQRLAELWPNAQLITTRALGHRRILRDAAVLAATTNALRDGVTPPASDLVREVDRQLANVDLFPGVSS
jgi:pimeloyl-ACP methyl ester carboxylesterase